LWGEKGAEVAPLFIGELCEVHVIPRIVSGT